MHEALKKGLPDIKPCELEKDEAVFYMNGKNGTAFDWYVNEHFPNFFIFYNDTENLGAVKATLYTDGGLTIYVYGEKGHAEPVTFEEQVEATAEELLDLAVMLTENADSKRIWDDDIRILETDGRPEPEAVDFFRSLEEAHEPMIERRNLLPKKCARADGRSDTESAMNPRMSVTAAGSSVLAMRRMSIRTIPGIWSYGPLIPL